MCVVLVYQGRVAPTGLQEGIRGWKMPSSSPGMTWKHFESCKWQGTAHNFFLVVSEPFPRYFCFQNISSTKTLGGTRASAD
jgi:hypothetical protein